MRSYLFLIASLILAASCGFLFGYIMNVELVSEQIPLRLVPDTRPKVPVAIIDGISDGKVTGTLQGELRLFLGDNQAIPDASGAFKVPADLFFKNIVHIDVPNGAHFVASRKGEKYYSVDSPSGQKLSVQNRIYFETAEQAEKAGYQQ